MLAYGEGGAPCYLMGYDQYNVTIYQPSSGESQKMGLNDANLYFEQLGNDFVCGIFPWSGREINEKQEISAEKLTDSLCNLYKMWLFGI